MGLHGSGQGSVAASLAEEFDSLRGIERALLTHVLYPQRLPSTLTALLAHAGEELPGEGLRGFCHSIYKR